MLIQAAVAVLQFKERYEEWVKGNAFRSDETFRRYFDNDVILVSDTINNNDFISVTDVQHILSRMRSFICTRKGNSELPKSDWRTFSLKEHKKYMAIHSLALIFTLNIKIFNEKILDGANENFIPLSLGYIGHLNI